MSQRRRDRDSDRDFPGVPRLYREDKPETISFLGVIYTKVGGDDVSRVYAHEGNELRITSHSDGHLAHLRVGDHSFDGIEKRVTLLGSLRELQRSVERFMKSLGDYRAEALSVFTDGRDLVVAGSPKEASRLLQEQTGRTSPGWKFRDIYEGTILRIMCDDDGNPAEGTGGNLHACDRSARDWCTMVRGFLGTFEAKE